MTKADKPRKLEALTSQMKTLKAQIAEERARSRMSPEQYKDAIDKLGLTQVGAGTFFGQSPRQGQRWASGEKPVPAGA